jgi:hypothetical protein
MTDTAEKTEQIGKSRILRVDASAFVMGDTPFSQFDQFSSLTKNIDWEADPTLVNGVRLVPHGLNNDLPVIIRDVMDKNNLAPGILEREIGLLYGDGPQLYEVVYENGFVRREYTTDPEIQAWLDSWDYKRYIDMAMVEFKYMKGIFTKVVRNRGPRVGAAGTAPALDRGHRPRNRSAPYNRTPEATCRL